MVNPIARFTSLAPPPAPSGVAVAPTPRPKPAEEARTAGVEVRLSGQARALLEQIAAARGEEVQTEALPASRLGTRINVVV